MCKNFPNYSVQKTNRFQPPLLPPPPDGAEPPLDAMTPVIVDMAAILDWEGGR